MATRLARWLVVLGVVLIVPSALALTDADPPFTVDDDLQAGFTPIVRVPLEGLRSGATVRLSYVVPASSQWARIRRRQGPNNQGYVVLVAGAVRGEALDFSPLGIEFSVVGSNGPLALTPTRNIFLYDDFGADIGRRFAATEGDRLQFAIKARNPERLPDGEFLVQPYWASQERLLFESDIDKALKRLVTAAARIGLILLVAGAAVNAVAAISGRVRSE
jgi:hypothetical protein